MGYKLLRRCVGGNNALCLFNWSDTPVDNICIEIVVCQGYVNHNPATDFLVHVLKTRGKQTGWPCKTIAVPIYFVVCGHDSTGGCHVVRICNPCPLLWADYSAMRFYLRVRYIGTSFQSHCWVCDIFVSFQSLQLVKNRISRWNTVVCSYQWYRLTHAAWYYYQGFQEQLKLDMMQLPFQFHSCLNYTASIRALRNTGYQNWVNWDFSFAPCLNWAASIRVWRNNW